MHGDFPKMKGVSHFLVSVVGTNYGVVIVIIFKRPITQIPESTCSISHNAPFRT